MERTLTVLNKEGDLYAQATFISDDLATVEMRCILNSISYIGDGKLPVIVPLGMYTYQLPFRKFISKDDIKAYDIATIKNELKGELKVTDDFAFVYTTDTAHHRYILTREGKNLQTGDPETEHLGIVDCSSNFAENTKVVKFTSMISSRHDLTVTDDSLKHNIEAILNLPGLGVPGQHHLSVKDIRKLHY